MRIFLVAPSIPVALPPFLLVAAAALGALGAVIFRFIVILLLCLLLVNIGAEGWVRTSGQRIFNAPLYQLSYLCLKS